MIGTYSKDFAITQDTIFITVVGLVVVIVLCSCGVSYRTGYREGQQAEKIIWLEDEKLEWIADRNLKYLEQTNIKKGNKNVSKY